MEISYILLALPYFLFFIGLELWVSRHGQQLYHLPDLISNLSCGLSQQMIMVFLRLPLFGVYVYVYEHRLISWQTSGLLFALLAFLFLDFVYYWWHRLSHQVSFLWLGHVVHHQSEHLNFSVGLRQDVFTNLTALPFELLVALCGVSPPLFLTMQSLATLYQFWIHTQLIGKLGPLEWILMTPSHHRAHHGTNPQYLDTNYGATFIFWDKLFGTFVEEKEAVIYGLTRPLRSFHPIWAQLQYWAELAGKWRRSSGVSQKLAALLRSPGWQCSPSDSNLNKDLRGYRRTLSVTPLVVAGASFVLAAILILALVLFRPSLLFWQRIVLALVSVFLFGVCGAKIEGLSLSHLGIFGLRGNKE
jgi:alkylglycerol monooxygenase